MVGRHDIIFTGFSLSTTMKTVFLLWDEIINLFTIITNNHGHRHVISTFYVSPNALTWACIWQDNRRKEWKWSLAKRLNKYRSQWAGATYKDGWRGGCKVIRCEMEVLSHVMRVFGIFLLHLKCASFHRNEMHFQLPIKCNSIIAHDKNSKSLTEMWKVNYKTTNSLNQG